MALTLVIGVEQVVVVSVPKTVLLGDDAEEGLVLQAILVLLVPAAVTPFTALHNGDEAVGLLDWETAAGDDGIESVSRTSRSVCVCCSTETETTLAVDVVRWLFGADDKLVA